MRHSQTSPLTEVVCVVIALVFATSAVVGAAELDKKRSSKSVADVPLKKALAASRRVDKLIEKGYARNNVEPNPIASDETFVRRVHLHIIGRIPTYDETIAFLDSENVDKRSELIDKLLDSEGYVSHQFNYWADLLRLQSRMRYAPAQPYLDFVKDSLRDNKPYDQFVRDLVTAEGYTWDNGAAGYYLRDTGMPLDNMSNTAQVFLGTQLVCAQCHDHPFDTWTQKQYYQLAAFTYGIQTRDRNHPMYREIRGMRRDKKLDQDVVRSAGRILQPLAYKVNETNRPLRLPDDYQYDDHEPKDQIDPATIFGEEVSIEPGDSPKGIYARWMTSAKNPRFTHVIANRLWKRAMGVGLIEPVDDIKEIVGASNSELMEFLVSTIVESNYDMKQYLRILYNTKTYQREVTVEELVEGEDYHFPGPVLRRLSAEQLWDSLLAMTIPELDARKGVVRDNSRYANGAELVDMEMKEILKLAKVEAERRKAQFEYSQATAEMQKDLRVAYRTQDRETIDKLRTKMNSMRKKIFGPRMEKQTQLAQQRAREQRRDTDPRWAGLSRDLVRASEVSSPARAGHFLRQFGQSDRETIENANVEATVPQILTLLNGPMYSQLINRNSVLSKRLLEAESPEAKLDVIFVSILNRRPTDEEQEIALPQIESDRRNGAGDVIWALLNTRQFIFVQ
ncbi:MAG: DUF1549 domain-containing protein [Pirellulaceae bacterium]|nr:DUF1549 domain-containing protein [Pirellulaceae bacterium]